MTEQQPYDVVAQHPGFELRRYPAHAVAEVVVDGSFEKAANSAFRDLAGYIGGQNAGSRTVAMTAPVVQEAPSRIAMTAPVVQEEGADPGSYVVAFVLPATYTADTAPSPSNARVTVRQVPEQLAAAARAPGRWTRSDYEEAVTALRSAVEAAGFTITGSLRYARFDPPWKPFFLRRNEVVAPVRAVSGANGDPVSDQR
jgi:hypothetical protein